MTSLFIVILTSHPLFVRRRTSSISDVGIRIWPRPTGGKCRFGLGRALRASCIRRKPQCTTVDNRHSAYSAAREDGYDLEQRLRRRCPRRRRRSSNASSLSTTTPDNRDGSAPPITPHVRSHVLPAESRNATRSATHRPADICRIAATSAELDSLSLRLRLHKWALPPTSTAFAFHGGESHVPSLSKTVVQWPTNSGSQILPDE